jgi:transcriptional regulator with XRE-family HTH domain
MAVEIFPQVGRASGEADPVDIHVGARARTRRILLGKSQEAVSTLLGISFQQLQKYENGVNRISASRLYDLAHILRVPISFFFDEMPEAARPFVEHGKSARKGSGAEAGSVEGFSDRTTLDLIREFRRIGSAKQRDCVLDLIRVMAEQHGGEGAADLPDRPRRGRPRGSKNGVKSGGRKIA